MNLPPKPSDIGYTNADLYWEKIAVPWASKRIEVLGVLLDGISEGIHEKYQDELDATEMIEHDPLYIALKKAEFLLGAQAMESK